MNNNKTIPFVIEDGTEVELSIIEQTKINGMNYLLVTETEDETEDADAFILKEELTQEEEVVYTIVEDETEISALSKVFGELLEDIDIEIES